MATLHTFGCSITQGHALPDIVKPVVNSDGVPYTPEEIEKYNIKINWEDIHLYQPSRLAWPQVLANRLKNTTVNNHARRGACFQQIARQCAANVQDIKPEDTVIVMWTYLSRLSLQWPARTAVPFCNITDPNWGWRTVMLGFNRFFGLESSKNSSDAAEQRIQDYIETSTKNTYLTPMGTYNRYYNSLVLQTMTDGFLRATGARVIHLSVEHISALQQLEEARQELDRSLGSLYTIPDPNDWYKLNIDYNCAPVLMDPRIPPAENDMHPSVTHHTNFAEYVLNRYF